MSINYCTISSASVDAFCSPRRALVFNRLVEELHPTIVVPPVVVPPVAGPSHASRDNFPWQDYQRPNWDIDDREPIPYEQTEITVTAAIMGLEGSHTIETAQAQLDFVSVTDLTFSDIRDAGEIVINITDLNI